MQEYAKARIISYNDILTMLLIYETFSLKHFIPKFFNVITHNPYATRLELSELIPYINVCLETGIGEKIMKTLAEYQFVKVKNFNKGSNELLETGVVKSKIGAHVLNTEKCDFKNFKIPESGEAPYEIEMYKFNIKLNMTFPTHDFYDYLTNFNKYLDKDDETLSSDLFSSLISYLWGYYQIEIKLYL